MAFAEDVYKLRKRIADAFQKDLVSKDKDFFEATLIQIMNDAEKQRVACLTQAENLRKQAAMIDGQASAYASFSGIVFNVLNGFVQSAEKAELERLELAKLEQKEEVKEEPKTEDKKKKKK